ncbi:MAG: CDP-alcohol phosphatidyltransferase family protein [Flavobacteriales bacterium]|nr:MAG: CDP-alcohol phosphatidyltransferase family protein [Flavobacteriales bacterium]
MPRLPRLPDLLTTANLCCGVLSILLASQGQLTIACGLIFLAAVFDVFDGLAARAMGGGSSLGAQLDSLADMVSFGVAPGMLMYFSFQTGIMWTREDGVFLGFSAESRSSLIVSGLAMVVPVASAWRLAKFNVDKRQSHGFLGLATPANALFWASVPLIVGSGAVLHGPAALVLQESFCRYFTMQPNAALATALVLAFLMLSELPLPSLKFKHFGWKGNEVIYCLLGIGLVLVLLYGILAVPLILVIYLLSPLWGKLFRQETRSK